MKMQKYFQGARGGGGSDLSITSISLKHALLPGENMCVPCISIESNLHPFSEGGSSPVLPPGSPRPSM